MLKRRHETRACSKSAFRRAPDGGDRAAARRGDDGRDDAVDADADTGGGGGGASLIEEESSRGTREMADRTVDAPSGPTGRASLDPSIQGWQSATLTGAGVWEGE